MSRYGCALVMMLAVPACTGAPTPVPPSAALIAPGAAAGVPDCRAASAQFALGQPYSEALANRARLASGAASVRRLDPGEIVTMEFRGDRLNLDVDAKGAVIRVRCG